MIGTGLVTQSTDTRLTVRLDDPKAIWHHAGTSGGIPSRPLIGLSSDDEVMIEDAAQDWIEDLLSGNL